MNLVRIDEIFDIQYGNQLNFNAMTTATENGVNFISRSSKNLGIVAKVQKINKITPFPKELITVTMGGTYLLSSFVQPSPFYTAQNIKVLKPKFKMSLIEKLCYCKVIESNRYKYTSHGREANSTFNSLRVPDYDFIKRISKGLKTDDIHISKSSAINIKQTLTDTQKWSYFKFIDIFNIKNGYYNKKPIKLEDGTIPFIGAVDNNNGVTEYYSLNDIENNHKDSKSKGHNIDKKIFKGNCVTISNNGSVGYAFYQKDDFTCSHDANVLYLKEGNWNKYTALFFASIIKKERFRWAYGRKWRPSRMVKSEIKLPADKNGNPDWQYMENYIKSLPYSSNL